MHRAVVLFKPHAGLTLTHAAGWNISEGLASDRNDFLDPSCAWRVLGVFFFAAISGLFLGFLFSLGSAVRSIRLEGNWIQTARNKVFGPISPLLLCPVSNRSGLDRVLQGAYFSAHTMCT